MAIRASLYLKGELQKEMQKRPNGVSDQLERLFDCYKYCRRQMEEEFEEAELDLLLYAQKYGEWDYDPKAFYGLGIAIKKALDDRLDALEPNGAAKKAAEKDRDKIVDEICLVLDMPGDYEGAKLEALNAYRAKLQAIDHVLNDVQAISTSRSDERRAEIDVWADAIYDGLNEDADIEYMMMWKLRKLHPFDLLTLVDALEQANKTENPRRMIRYLLPGWGERAMDVTRSEQSLGVEGTKRWLESRVEGEK